MPPPADDHERFMRLFLAHEREIMRLILIYVPQQADACDVLQETAVALWNRFSDYDPGRPFVNWACGFAGSKCAASTVVPGIADAERRSHPCAHGQ